MQWKGYNVNHNEFNKFFKMTSLNEKKIIFEQVWENMYYMSL